MYGISTINIELTSRCNKDCHMCGRRKLEATKPGYKESLGDMDYNMFLNIIDQVHPGTVTQLHWNGEPTLYPYLAKAAYMAKRHAGAIVCMDTNGLMLGSLKNCHDFDSITVSVITGDTFANYQTQADQIALFCAANDTMVNLRILGDDVAVDFFFQSVIDHYGLQLIRRTLHDANMSRNYQRRVTMPEIGVCLDLLHHLAIDRNGDIYPCVRFNPAGLLRLGNVATDRLADVAQGEKRQTLINAHFEGRRKDMLLCGGCHFYGCPVG